MSRPAGPASKPGLPAWTRAGRVVAPPITWARGITRSPRQATLLVCVIILLVISIVSPLGRGAVIDSVQVSIAFFATLLTGEAVIFALSFSPSSAWPSLREIDSHIAFREWVITGSLAGMLTAGGLLLLRNEVPATYGALLFLLADLFGVFSFVRLFGLASAEGRKRLLRRTLAGELATVTAPPDGLRQRMRDSHVLNAYLGQIDEAAARSDGNGVRDLADQLATIPATASDTAALALHLDVIHRLAKAALVGKLDPVVASGAADALLGSLLTRATTPAGAGNEIPVAHRAAGAMAQASRYLAWLASTSLIMSERDVTTAGAARELVAFTVRARDHVLRLADPDPPYAAGSSDLGTPLADTVSALAWINGFTEFHGSHQAAGLYPVYEILSGTKFLGNYWDGDSVLTGLREALFAPGGVNTPAAHATRRSFRQVENFDRVWTLISAGMIATLRDVRRTHPPELIRPEFSSDPQLLGAYVRTFASHRYFTTADQATRALIQVIGHAGHPGGLWHQIRATTAPLSWSVPMPAVEPHRRLSACVLAVASRLAPLTAGESDRELGTFLAALPPDVLEATTRLATRTLPLPDTGTGAGPGDNIAARLQVLQLVGTHRASQP